MSTSKDTREPTNESKSRDIAAEMVPQNKLSEMKCSTVEPSNTQVHTERSPTSAMAEARYKLNVYFIEHVILFMMCYV